MRVVQIDGFDFHPSQALLALLFNLARAQAPLHFAVAKAHLRGEKQFPPILAFLHPSAQQGFALAAPEAFYPMGIDVGCVEECSARFQILVQQAEGHFAVDTRAIKHGTQAQRADLLSGRTQQHGFHTILPDRLLNWFAT